MTGQFRTFSPSLFIVFFILWSSKFFLLTSSFFSLSSLGFPPGRCAACNWPRVKLWIIRILIVLFLPFFILFLPFYIYRKCRGQSWSPLMCFTSCFSLCPERCDSRCFVAVGCSPFFFIGLMLTCILWFVLLPVWLVLYLLSGKRSSRSVMNVLGAMLQPFGICVFLLFHDDED